MNSSKLNIFKNEKGAKPGKNYLLRDYRNLTLELQKYSEITINPETLRKRKKIKILLIEDDIINQRLTKMILDKQGFTVDTASNGKSGVEKYKLENYDLILMDIQMPVMDGLLASQKIREYELIQKADKTVPIIALSADSYSDNVELLFDAGINYYMEKPFSFNKFISLLDIK